MIDAIGDAVFYAGLIGILTFTILYGVRSRWWKYPEGVALFARDCSLSLIALYVGAVLIDPKAAWRDGVRLGVYCVFLLASLFSLGVLIYSQGKSSTERARLRAEYEAAREREDSAE